MVHLLRSIHLFHFFHVFFFLISLLYWCKGIRHGYLFEKNASFGSGVGGVIERSRMCARCWEIFLSIPAVRRADDGRHNNQMHDVYTKLDHDLGIRHVEKRWLQLLLSAAHHDERRFMKGHWFACDGGVWQTRPFAASHEV